MEFENEGPAKVVPGDHKSDDLFFSNIIPDFFYDAVSWACDDRGVTNFWSYCRGEEDDANDDAWYDPDDGLQIAAALIAHFEADPKASKDPYMPAFMEELRAFEDALREAKRRGRRFRLFLNT
jgi:hypothetical protein